jgi:hypothetical protein
MTACVAAPWRSLRSTQTQRVLQTSCLRPRFKAASQCYHDLLQAALAGHAHAYQYGCTAHGPETTSFAALGTSRTRCPPVSAKRSSSCSASCCSSPAARSGSSCSRPANSCCTRPGGKQAALPWLPAACSATGLLLFAARSEKVLQTRE